MIELPGEQFSFFRCGVEDDPGHARQMSDGRCRDHEQDNGAERDDLPGAERETHTRQVLYLWSLLCRVLRLMPRISAARVLLPPVCLSVLRISSRSASSTVVPTGSTTSASVVGVTGATDVPSGGRCSLRTKSPAHTMTARSITFRSSRTFPGQR